MSDAGWEDLKEVICKQLFLGKENGEDELDTMARIILFERQKHLTLTISERLQQFYKAALGAVEKPVTSPVDRERGADSGKGKLLKWKTRSCLIGASISPCTLDPVGPAGNCPTAVMPHIVPLTSISPIKKARSQCGGAPLPVHIGRSVDCLQGLLQDAYIQARR
jgi:hypothetical protein